MPQTLEKERAVEENEVRPPLTEIFDEEKFDPAVEYDDEYYADYIRDFEPNKKKRLFYRFVKRSFDILASFAMLLMLALPFLVIAVAIKIDSKGPVVFKQDRMGKGGKPFKCLKFRSMKIDTPHDTATSLLSNPELYYTKVGKFLRKTSLDELPQLWCVFIGKMSFIGYRPLVLTESKCNDMREKLGVFALRPGISGYAQVHGRDDVYYKNKAILDSIYVKNASILFDLKLVFSTIAVVFKREGNDANKNENNKNQAEKEIEEGAKV